MLKGPLHRLQQHPQNKDLNQHQKNYQKLVRQAGSSKYESLFMLQSSAYDLPFMEHNYKFDLPDSGMELDFAHIPSQVGVEIQGGIFSHKRLGHSTGQGISRDIKKFNAAQLKGWLLILLTPEMAINGSGVLLVKEAIRLREGYTPRNQK